MTQTKSPRLPADFALEYAYVRFCNEYDAKGFSQSLRLLADVAKKTFTENPDRTHSQQVDELIKDFPDKVKQQIMAVELASEGYFKIDRDCQDENYIEKSAEHLNALTKVFNKRDDRSVAVRMKILDRLYDFDELLHPNSHDTRVDLLSRMVRDIRENKDGRFDYEPLNTSARRLIYACTGASADRRYKLILEIKKRTKDSARYDYSDAIADIHAGYKEFQAERNEEIAEQNRIRYAELRREIRQNQFSPEEQIERFKEMTTLVDDLKIGRRRKFETKADLYDKLVSLCELTGDVEGRKNAAKLLNTYRKAAYRAQEAARKKGYTTISKDGKPPFGNSGRS